MNSDDAALAAPHALWYTVLNPTHYAIKAFAGQKVGEQEGQVAAHAAAVALHHGKVGAHVRSKINLIDDE